MIHFQCVRWLYVVCRVSFSCHLFEQVSSCAANRGQIESMYNNSNNNLVHIVRDLIAVMDVPDVERVYLYIHCHRSGT